MDHLKKKRIFSVVVPILSLVLSLALVEAVLVAVGFSFKLYPEKVQFGWPPEKTIQDMYTRDRDLYWVPKDYYQRLDGYIKNPPKIVFMGDSCTEFGRYDQQLAKMVSKKHPGKTLNFGNVGVGGWSSYQGVQQLKRDVSRIKPNVATLYYGWNDHWYGFGIEDKDVRKVNNSLLHSLQRFRLAQLLTKAIVANQRDDRPKRVSSADFRQNLKQMVAVAKQNNIIPVLLTAPSSHQKGKEPAYLAQRWLTDLSTLVPVHQKYVSIVREVATSEKAAMCDLAKEMAKLDPEYLSTQIFNLDGIHLSEKGNEKIAELLYQCFSDNDLLDEIL